MSNDAILRLTKKVHRLERELRRVQITGFQRPTWLTTPLTSVNWDGDAYSTTAKTLIDLSAVFGAPANIKAVLMQVQIRDSASAAGDYFLILGADNVAARGIVTRCSGLTNNALTNHASPVTCDANGDVYYQILASGANTMDVVLQIWGYWL